METIFSLDKDLDEESEIENETASLDNETAPVEDSNYYLEILF